MNNPAEPHTAGPWTVDVRTGLDVMGPDGKDVCVALCKPMRPLDLIADSIGPETRMQGCINAFLIAAAPELLAACKAAERALLNSVGTLDAWTLVCAAIEKAEGRT